MQLTMFVVSCSKVILYTVEKFGLLSDTERMVQNAEKNVVVLLHKSHRKTAEKSEKNLNNP